ncbi:J domain-containing protein [Caulobacter sp. BK020]|uniref:J domain-containing protein n=1 Tax=Caulobacter sp. BK020 TaxID=2512117 RepID=UPI001050CAA9|nr:J domain-containing protein [Caulobacter sp. BK020]TCS13297.1 hypothetical protein EV278_110166 [Caulobacter sp. BK020]
MNSEIWQVLGLEPVRDRDAIRRAYARRLKVTSPEDDAEGFRILREAYEQALSALDWDWAWEDDDGQQNLEQQEGEPPPVAGVFADAADVLTLLRGGVPAFEAARRPDPSALHGHDAHERLLAELEGLVADPTDDAPARLEASLAAIVASPAMEVLAVAVHTEQHIAHLIADNAPRSDPLVRPAINAFRWSRDRTGLHGGGVIEAVLDRDADIIFRSGLLRDQGPRRPAFLALTRPLNRGPSWRDRCWPGFEPAMRAVLAEIGRRPSLRADVDPETLTAWEERLTRPHLSPLVLWIAALIPLIPAPLGLMTSPLTALGLYMMGAAACLAVSSLWIFGVLPLRRAWGETWAWRAPIWARAGWAPLSLALLLLASLAPANAWATAGIGLCAAALALWAVVTSEVDADPSPKAWPLPLKLLVGQSVLVVWWGFLMTVAPEATPPAATVAFAGAMIASAAGASSLPILWYRWTIRPLRFALILALAGAAIWTALQLLDPREATGGAAMAAAATAAVILAHRPAAGGLGPTALQWRYRVQAFSFIPVIGAGTELGWLKVSGLWLLAGVATALIGAIVLEKDL